MRLASWKQRDPGKLELTSRNLMVAAIEPDKCWEIAGFLRNSRMPSNVLVCETAFLMGSIARDIIRTVMPQEYRRQCITSAEVAFFTAFDGLYRAPLPREMSKIYGTDSLGHVARIALAAYGEENDLLFLTSASLVRRLKGDPRMTQAITPLLKKRAWILRAAFSSAIS